MAEADEARRPWHPMSTAPRDEVIEFRNDAITAAGEKPLLCHWHELDGHWISDASHVGTFDFFPAGRLVCPTEWRPIEGERQTTFTVAKMLDNAATASQARQLLEPVTRGAVLRSVVQWLEAQRDFDPHYCGWIVDEMKADPNYEE